VRLHGDELVRIGDDEARRDRLAELNVAAAVQRIGDTPILRRAWDRGRAVWIHGLIYRLSDGLLEDLHCSLGPAG